MYKTKKFCRATMCCWKLMERDEYSPHWQYFVITTYGVVYNLSSNIFSKSVEQIGATFYGGLSEHCTGMPIYVSNDMKKVCIKPHGKNYNLGWGKSH